MQKFNVLSLSGGGYMGLYSALVLSEIEQKNGRPIGESFDLVAGTSIGGILALAIAQGTELEKVVRSFLKNGDKIFSQRPTPKTKMERVWDTLRFISGSKYDNLNLRSAIEEFIDPDLRMGDLERRVAIASVNLTKGLPHTFRTAYSPIHSNSASVRCIDVALATSAAPTLLPIHEIRQEFYSDGGAYANSPDLIGMHEAETICGVNPAKIHMLSVGSTTATYDFPRPQSTSFGLREWTEGQRIVKVVLATQQCHASRIIKGRIGERYFRVDQHRTAEESLHTGLDVADETAIGILKDLAEKTAACEERRIGVEVFLRHQAAPVPGWYPDNGITSSIY